MSWINENHDDRNIILYKHWSWCCIIRDIEVDKFLLISYPLIRVVGAQWLLLPMFTSTVSVSSVTCAIFLFCILFSRYPSCFWCRQLPGQRYSFYWWGTSFLSRILADSVEWYRKLMISSNVSLCFSWNIFWNSMKVIKKMEFTSQENDMRWISMTLFHVKQWCQWWMTENDERNMR